MYIQYLKIKNYHRLSFAKASLREDRYSHALLLVTVSLLPSCCLHIYIVSMIITYIINRLLNRYIVKALGGTTGDTYGFVVEVTEVLLILVYIVILSILSATVANNPIML